MKYTYEDMAKMIDHSLLNPALTVDELESGIQLALAYDAANDAPDVGLGAVMALALVGHGGAGYGTGRSSDADRDAHTYTLCGCLSPIQFVDRGRLVCGRRGWCWCGAWLSVWPLVAKHDASPWHIL